MTKRIVKTEQQRDLILKYIKGRKLPFSVSVSDADIRSNAQNALQRLWLKELEDQGDHTAEEYRGYCKLHFGVAIMKSESPEWAEKYDKIIRPMAYIDKLDMMMEPMDFPVTRCMSPKGKMKYLDAMYQYFTGHGYQLTDPNSQGMENYREARS
jgi:hypothetical protein